MTETEKNTALSQLLIEIYNMVEITRAEAEGTLDACATIEAQADELARVILVDRPHPAAVYDALQEATHG